MYKKTIIGFLLSPVLLLAQGNSKTNRVTRYYYDDQVTSIEIWYGSDKIKDSTKTYYASGKLNEVFFIMMRKD